MNAPGLPGGHLVPILLILLAGCLPYLNTLDSAFVFDDEPSIVLNQLIRKLSNFLPGGAGWREQPTRFIGYLSFAVNYRVGGLDVTGYHAVNIAIHVGNALLVYAFAFLLRKTLGNRQSQEVPSSKGMPLLAALLFAVHPMQTEAVSYIVQRLASLTTMFYLCSIVAYAIGRLAVKNVPSHGGGRSLPWYFASLICALLAMKTKEIALTLPVVITLFEFSFLQGEWRRRLFLVLPYFLIALVIPLSILRMDQPLGKILADSSEVVRIQTNLPRTVYLFTEFRVIATYLRLLVLPTDQNLDYDYPVYWNLSEHGVLLSLLLILFLLGAALLLFMKSDRKNDARWRISAFGIFWFFITLSVESSVIPIVDVIFEHRTYLPSVGAFLAFASLASLGIERIPLQSKNTWAVIFSCVVILALGSGTVARNRVWKDKLTLWEDVVRKSPGKARPHYNLGIAYAERGRIDHAIDQYLLTIRLRPDYTNAWENLGLDYAKKGLLVQAVEALEMAISIDPALPQPYYNLGHLYLTAFRGKEEDAGRLFRKALVLKPDHTDSWANLAATLIRQGAFQEAERAAMQAIALDPGHVNGHFNLSVALFQQGNRERALAEMEIVMGMDPVMGENLKQYLSSAVR